MLSILIIAKKTEDTKKFTEKSTERVDENGVKYIVYEENPVSVDEDAEVYIFNPTI